MTPAAEAVHRAVAEWGAWPTLSIAAQKATRDRYIREGVRSSPVAGFEWCGAFLAWCWMAVHPTLRSHLMASTYRLKLFGSCAIDSNLWPNNGVRLADGKLTTVRKLHLSDGDPRQWATGAACAVTSILPGDILCVRSGKKDTAVGGHIVLAIERCDLGYNSVVTISGNGWGERANGTVGGGVVRNVYDRKDVRQILRLSAHDLDPALTYLGG